MIHPPAPKGPTPPPSYATDPGPAWPHLLFAFALIVTIVCAAAIATGCAELGPVMSALPGVVSAVEAVTAAAKAQGRPLDAEVLAEAKALDAAHEAAEKARDKRLAAILAAVKRKPAACVPVVVAVPSPPVASAAPVLLVDAGAEGGAR